MSITVADRASWPDAVVACETNGSMVVGTPWRDDGLRCVRFRNLAGGSYTLDNVGNRIGEQIKDPTGVLQRSIGRSFDALNRLQQVTGAAQ